MAVRRVDETVGNRTGSAGSRWNRSGPVHEPVRFPLINRAYIFLTPANRPVSPVYRPVFLNRGNRSGSGFGNPGCANIRIEDSTKGSKGRRAVSGSECTQADQARSNHYRKLWLRQQPRAFLTAKT
jgi:hypothetical protein